MHELKCRILQVLQVEGDLHIFFFQHSELHRNGMEAMHASKCIFLHLQ